MDKKFNKQFQGSKKAGRRREYWKRKTDKYIKKEVDRIINDPNSTIEEIAEAMGVRLN
jgi:hypothetical protein